MLDKKTNKKLDDAFLAAVNGGTGQTGGGDEEGANYTIAPCPFCDKGNPRGERKIWLFCGGRAQCSDCKEKFMM